MRAIPLTALLSACTFTTAPPPASDWDTRVVSGSGCGNMLVSATNRRDTRGVQVLIRGLVSRAEAAGGTLSETYAMPLTWPNQIQAVAGQRMSSVVDCWGFPPPPPTITAEWRPVSGTLTATVEPNSVHTGFHTAHTGVSPAYAQVVLTDVVFERISGTGPAQFTVPHLEWQDVVVGPIPF